MTDDKQETTSATDGGDAGDASQSPPRERESSWWRQLVQRRSFKWLFLIGLAALILHTMRGRPVDLEVTYHLGAARHDLQLAIMRYLQGGEEASRVRFDYRQQGAGLTQLHRVHLAKGDYQVAVELVYSKKPPARLGSLIAPHPAGQAVNLRRPLTVQGQDKAAIYFLDDD